MTNRQIVIAELPTDALGPEHFTMTETATPEPGAGEVQLRVILMSIDAANRSWMKGATYRAAVQKGDAMPTYAICEVMQSNSPKLSPGDIVAAEATWSEVITMPAHKVMKMPKVETLSHLMSVYGIAGKTAYHGLMSIGQPVAGETVLVSAAAGSVGGYVGQIAKALGCRVVGIAGGAEKCAWVTDHLGFDACLDYRAPGFFQALRSACPDGVDVYFDNVGGTVLEMALNVMNERGRVICCGAISQYDTENPTGPRNLPGVVVVKRLKMEGFIVMDFAHNDAKCLRAMQHWVGTGQIKVTEDIVDGLENAPQALIGLLAGDNKGKRMVRVSSDPS
ncbi:NADP-dependent oxidoreductase [Sulfitobacter mediterraneus]|uniref:NADP-dependent oxidoreductase n=1 Tax=Sulfitobacter mediterraneus TaxID=83219 RepID=UPI00193ACA22|nr:NADP-dependent oxidoreductase [Sulfitobacter mediterraneus]MBM1558626.1 NADP-dependent oxidoreductase [Sulfitobacter mediterraneus]MBM1569992.1 NADP-dependent oxidoreductase [Sulfitobacter mediterraneus]MBM1573946.1 NADP-dependent oxidoreductase [Sulfitobacter mediterraneus]MBM1577720.1 NADP-dependent oxidoreductase [Sulfitobacter mediterraneus]MBM1581609.1 NADP-dependent oxidoreductase [Sulfitobacter mediterraneus]